MVTIDDVRELALTLPRSYEALVRDRVKFRVGRIVYLAFSRDGTVMGFAFPKEFLVAMDEFSISIVLGGVIAEQTQVKKIGGAGKEFKRRKIAFIEWTGVGPNPADTVFFQQPDNLRPVPSRMTEFNGEPKISRQLREEFGTALGAVAPEQVVHMCGSGVTACHNLLAMEYAGLHGSRLYAPSWSGWVSDPARPVATGA